MKLSSITKIYRSISCAIVISISLISCGQKNDTNAARDTTTSGISNTLPAASAAVTDVTTCRAVSSDIQPVMPSTEFHPTDTIRAIVKVENANGSEKVGVSWVFTTTNTTVRHDESAIAHSGTVSTPFMIQKSSGLDAGDYRVDATINGTTQKSSSFHIVK